MRPSLLLAMLSGAAAKRVVVVGAGWGGLSAAHHLSRQPGVEVTVVDAAERPGGLVSDSWLTPGGRRAEAGSCLARAPSTGHPAPTHARAPASAGARLHRRQYGQRGLPASEEYIVALRRGQQAPSSFLLQASRSSSTVVCSATAKCLRSDAGLRSWGAERHLAPPYPVVNAAPAAATMCWARARSGAMPSRFSRRYRKRERDEMDEASA